MIITILLFLLVLFGLYSMNPKQPKKPNTIVIGKDNKPRYNQTGRYAKNEALRVHKPIKYTDNNGLVSWI